jgi:flagellar basal-body rod protein FlgB
MTGRQPSWIEGGVGPRTGRTSPFQEIRPVLFDTTQLALKGVIAGAAQRHEALAANLANANTPGYRRVDVDFHTALRAALDEGPGAAGTLDGMSFSPRPDLRAGAVQADGSTVDAERESADLAENAMEQQAAVQIAQTRIHILESAMGVGGR